MKLQNKWDCRHSEWNRPSEGLPSTRTSKVSEINKKRKRKRQHDDGKSTDMLWCTRQSQIPLLTKRSLQRTRHRQNCEPCIKQWKTFVHEEVKRRQGRDHLEGRGSKWHCDSFPLSDCSWYVCDGVSDGLKKREVVNVQESSTGGEILEFSSYDSEKVAMLSPTLEQDHYHKGRAATSSRLHECGGRQPPNTTGGVVEATAWTGNQLGAFR